MALALMAGTAQAQDTYTSCSQTGASVNCRSTTRQGLDTSIPMQVKPLDLRPAIEAAQQAAAARREQALIEQRIALQAQQQATEQPHQAALPECKDRLLKAIDARDYELAKLLATVCM